MSFTGSLNSGKAIDVTASEVITVTVNGGTWATQGWGSRVGIWIDANRDGSFSSTECMVDPSSNIASGPTNYTLKMPCWTSTGTSYMRIRGGASVYTMSASNGCGQAQTYGNVSDLELNLKLGATPTANFIVPTGTNYVKTNVKFSAINPSSGYAYKWTFDKADAPPYTGYSDKTDKGAAKWASAGTYDVKLLVNYCGLADSASKTVKIVAPTAVPKADFVASTNESEIYYDVTMFDLSDNGAYSFSFLINSSPISGLNKRETKITPVKIIKNSANKDERKMKIKLSRLLIDFYCSVVVCYCDYSFRKIFILKWFMIFYFFFN